MKPVWSLALLVTLTASGCREPLIPRTTGAIRLEVVIAPGASAPNSIRSEGFRTAAGFSSVLACTQGVTSKCLDLQLQSGFWIGTLDGLKPGSYCVTVDAFVNAVLASSGRTCNVVVNPGQTVPASLTLVQVIPAAPSGLVANALGSGSEIDLTWQDNSVNEDGFEIGRCTGTGCTVVAIDTVGANLTGYQNTGLTPGTNYAYQVRAFNTTGASAPSAATATTPSAPTAPTNLTATPAISGTQIDLTWQDNSNNESGFRISRCAGAGCTSFVVIDSVGPNLAIYQNTGLTPGTSYSYQVVAYNAVGPSPPSNIATNTTPTSPAAPSNLSATAAVSGTQIDLNWQDNSSNESGFRISRCAGAGCTSFVVIDSVGPNLAIYQNTGLTPGTSYSYQVVAYNAVGPSLPSNIATNTTPTAPGAPSNLTATAAVSGTQIDLTWQDNSNNESGFRISRCAGAGCTSFVDIDTVGPNLAAYQNTGLTPGTIYGYQVLAYNPVGASPSNIATDVTPNAPAAPSNLSATAAASGTRIDLAWQDNSTNESGFRISRCVGAGCTSFADIDTVAPNLTTYQNTGLTPGATYSYQVLTYNTVGTSPPSNIATDTTPNAPAAPSNLNAVLFSSSQINLTWTDNATDEIGFRIERCTGACTTFVQIDSVGPDVTAYANTGLTTGLVYRYRVQAYNAAGSSDYPNAAGATRYGDVDWDGCVDQQDLDAVFAAWGRTDRPPEDINQDGKVDIGDLGILLSNWTAPGTTTDSATTVASTGAVLYGSVGARGVATTAWFEWGTDPTLQIHDSTAKQAIGADTTTVPVQDSLSGLVPGTTYYYRVVAENSSGCRAKGSILSFTAQPPSTQQFLLTLNLQGTGTGTVRSSPAGIDCTTSGGLISGTCAMPFDSGAVVSLDTLLAAPSVFAEWGGGCSGRGSCAVTMTGPQTVSARFEFLSGTLQSGVPAGGSGSAGSKAFFRFVVPPGGGINERLRISLSGGSGDADLYVRYNGLPDISVYDCAPLRRGLNDETCDFRSPAAGEWFVMVYGYADWDNVTVVAELAPWIAGGTFSLRSSGIVGTSLVFDPTEPPPSASLDFLDVDGPPGWNGDSPARAYRYQPQGTAATRSIWWFLTSPVNGQYVARIGVLGLGGFDVDATSVLEAPAIDSLVDASYTFGRVVLNWTAAPASRSFMVRVDSVAGGQAVTLREMVVPGDARSATITMPLWPSVQYRAVVFAFSQDIQTPDAVNGQFNIAADIINFMAAAGLVAGQRAVTDVVPLIPARRP